MRVYVCVCERQSEMLILNRIIYTFVKFEDERDVTV